MFTIGVHIKVNPDPNPNHLTLTHMLMLYHTTYYALTNVNEWFINVPLL